MNKPEILAPLAPDLHDRDFYTWAMETARAVRQRRLDGIDWDSVAEELEDMGRSEKRELTNRLTVLLTHLLKWQMQSDRRSRSWTLTILEQRREADQLLRDNPGLKSLSEDVLAAAFRVARLRAARQTRLDLGDLPADCPWGLSQVLDETFLPEA